MFIFLEDFIGNFFGNTLFTFAYTHKECSRTLRIKISLVFLSKRKNIDFLTSQIDFFLNYQIIISMMNI